MKTWLAVAVAAGLVFLFVWEQVQATRLGFELDGARRAAQEARGRNAHLRLELERRTAPAELALLARERLGMLPPTPDSVVMLAEAGARPQAPAEALVAEAKETAAKEPGAARKAIIVALATEPATPIAPASAGTAGLRPARPATPGDHAKARIGTQLLSWLLPADTPGWR